MVIFCLAITDYESIVRAFSVWRTSPVQSRTPPAPPPPPPKKDKTKQKQNQKNYPRKKKDGPVQSSPESRPEFSPGFFFFFYETWARVHMIICQYKIPYKYSIMSFFSLRTLFAPGWNYVHKWRRQYLFKHLEVFSTRSNRFCYQHHCDNIWV